MFRFIIEKSGNQNEFKKIVSNSLIVIIAGILLLTLTVIIVNIIHPFSYWLYFIVYLSANILYTFTGNLLRGLGKMKEYAIISSGRNVLQVILNVIAIAVLKLGFTGLIISMCVTELLAFVIIFFDCKLWKHITLKQLSFRMIKSMLIYSFPLIPNAIGAQIINVSDRFIISAMLGSSQNGIYSISYKFPNIIETVYHYFYTAWSESAARSIDHDKENAETYYRDLHKTIENVIFAVILMLTAGMPILFRIFIRGDYVEGFTYVPILMFAMYFDSMGKFFSGIFTAYKKTNIMAVSTMIAAVLNVVINIILIKELGLYAAAISTLISEIVLYLIRVISLRKTIKFNYSFAHIAFEIVAVIAIVMLYDYNNWAKIIISILIALTVSAITNRQLIKTIFTTSKQIIKSKLHSK
jgi:O-antigen/teichoic acid export membrane protein